MKYCGLRIADCGTPSPTLPPRWGGRWWGGNPKSNGGFTLIEILVFIVIAGILLPAIVVPFATAVKGSLKPEKVSTSMYLAHQRMEELMKFDYGNAALNPRTLTVWANAGLPNYDYQFEILYVPNIDLTVLGSVIPPDTGYKRMRIRVRDPETDIYEVYSVVTNFP